MRTRTITILAAIAAIVVLVVLVVVLRPWSGDGSSAPTTLPAPPVTSSPPQLPPSLPPDTEVPIEVATLPPGAGTLPLADQSGVILSGGSAFIEDESYQDWEEIAGSAAELPDQAGSPESAYHWQLVLETGRPIEQIVEFINRPVTNPELVRISEETASEMLRYVGAYLIGEGADSYPELAPNTDPMVPIRGPQWRGYRVIAANVYSEFPFEGTARNRVTWFVAFDGVDLDGVSRFQQSTYVPMVRDGEDSPWRVDGAGFVIPGGI